MKQYLLFLFNLFFCTSSLFGNDDVQLKITHYNPPIKVKTTLVENDDSQVLINISSQLSLIIMDYLSDSIFNDLITKKRRISFIFSLDWKGNVSLIRNRSIGVSDSISEIIMYKIKNNAFHIPIPVSIVKETFYVLKNPTNVKCFITLNFDPISMMKHYSKSPYFLKEVPDSVITKEAILKLSKEILATPLKINHDFDSLMNINPQKIK